MSNDTDLYDAGDDVVGSDDDDEIEVTAKEVYDKLTEAWLNEKFAPELLESQVELVECMLAQVKELENNFTSKDRDLVSSLQKIELERVKFVITSYLRERLKKIENNVIHILAQESKGEKSKLSPEELVFAKSFADSIQTHLNVQVLQQMPPNMQALDQKKNIPKPNMDAYVLIKVKEKQEQVLLDPEDEPTDLEEGSQHILRYQPISPFVVSSTISLI